MAVPIAFESFPYVRKLQFDFFRHAPLSLAVPISAPSDVASRSDGAHCLAGVDALVALLHILFLRLLLVAQDEKVVPLLFVCRFLRISLLFFLQLLDLELAGVCALLSLAFPLRQLVRAQR